MGHVIVGTVGYTCYVGLARIVVTFEKALGVRLA